MHDQAGITQFSETNDSSAGTFHGHDSVETGSIWQSFPIQKHNTIDHPLWLPYPSSHMANESIADLLAVDTSSLESRLLELRRYL